MLIQMTTGSELLKVGSSKFHVFALSTNERRLPKQEMHIGMAAKLATSGIDVTQREALAAGRGSTVNQGTWWRTIYDVQEGQVFKVWGWRKTSGRAYNSNVGMTRSAAFLIQTRAHAALRRVKFTQLDSALTSVKNVTIEGRFDIVSLKTAARAGVQIPVEWAGQFNHHNRHLQELFTVTKLADEIMARRTVATETVIDEDGNTTDVPVTKPQRAIDLD
jgi:hypothetical protein